MRQFVLRPLQHTNSYTVNSILTEVSHSTTCKWCVTYPSATSCTALLIIYTFTQNNYDMAMVTITLQCFMVKT